MRVIFLNTWYGQLRKSFFTFIKTAAKKTTIFGLTEVDPKLFTELSQALRSFQGIYETNGKKHNYGQAIFVKRGIKIQSQQRFSLYRNVSNDLGFGIILHLIEKKPFFLINLHGKVRPGHKLDTPARIRQSERLLNLLKNKKGPKIIGGDFNLLPETRSIKMIEAGGYRNLIKEFGIKTTRNKYAWRTFLRQKEERGGEKFIKQNFADYCFVSPEVRVKDFQVPRVEVSDHLPLILDFEI